MASKFFKVQRQYLGFLNTARSPKTWSDWRSFGYIGQRSTLRSNAFAARPSTDACSQKKRQDAVVAFSKFQIIRIELGQDRRIGPMHPETKTACKNLLAKRFLEAHDCPWYCTCSPTPATGCIEPPSWDCCCQHEQRKGPPARK